MSTEEWLTVEQISKELHTPVKTIQSWIRQGRLVAYKPGRSYLVKRSDLTRFLEEHKTRRNNQ